MEVLWKVTVFAQFWANYPKVCGNCAFSQNFHARKLGEIMVFSAAKVFKDGSSKICERQPLSRPYPFKFFKGCLPQILIGPFLNTLSYIM